MKFVKIFEIRIIYRNERCSTIKTIQLSLVIGKGDLERKMKQAQKFLEKKEQVRIQLLLRGRQKGNPERGIEFLLDSFEEYLSDYGKLVNRPNSSNLNLTLMPKSKS